MDPNGNIAMEKYVIRLMPSLRSEDNVFLIVSSLEFAEVDMTALSSLSSQLPSSSSCHERQGLQKSRQGL